MSKEKRVCQFCGKDISDLKANATICGSKECTTAYKKWKKNLPKIPRFCEICGENIDNLPGQRRICKNPECIAEQKRRKYKELTKEKTCVECGRKFDATQKQSLCPKCREKSAKKHLDDIKRLMSEAEIIQQEIRCKYCGELIKYKSVRDTPKTKSTLFTGVCEVCKKKNRKRISESMKGNTRGKGKRKPRVKLKTSRIKLLLVFLKIFLKKLINLLPKKFKKFYSRYKLKRRMKMNNPVFNRETIEKIRKTTKTRREQGIITTKKGSESPLWKGGAELSRSIRIALRPWVADQLKEKDYTCEECKTRGGELHVHHQIPLRDIIKMFLEKSGKTREYLNKIKGSPEFLSFVDEVVKYHYDNPSVGKVVCYICHNKIDNHYRRLTPYKKHGKNKKNKKKKRK